MKKNVVVQVRVGEDEDGEKEKMLEEGVGMTKLPPSSPSSASASNFSATAAHGGHPLRHHRRYHFVLIHGFCHGAWCWYKVRCLLENSGHRVTCLDLKSSGIDPTDANTILSFDDYNRPLVDFLTALPGGEKVILVGHSAGGLSVTQAILSFPHKLEAAVFVAATMLQFGFHSEQDFKDGAPDLSEYGDAYDFQYGQGGDKPPTAAIFKKDILRRVLYQMSPLEDCTLAEMVLKPGPFTAVLDSKFIKDKGQAEDTNYTDTNTSIGKAADVSRFYIKTLQDKVLKLEQQEALIKRWQPTKVYSVDTDHSPFFSNPFLLSGVLVDIAIAGCGKACC